MPVDSNGRPWTWRIAAVLLLVAAALGAQQAHQETDHNWWSVGWHGHPEVTMVEWLAREEGMKLQAYPDAAGNPTICVGHRVRSLDVEPKTRQECLELLDQDLERFRAGVDEAIAIELNDNQSTALVSLAFNIGLGAFGSSDLVRLINGMAPEHLVVIEWVSWDKAHIDGKLQVLDSLQGRRRREAALFFRLPWPDLANAIIGQ